MKPDDLLKKVMDQANKLQARTKLPTGGDGRMLEEAINTSANAKGLASLTTKKPTAKRL